MGRVIVRAAGAALAGLIVLARVGAAQTQEFWPQLHVYAPATSSTQGEFLAEWTAARDSVYRQLRLGATASTRPVHHLELQLNYSYYYTPSDSKKNENRIIAEGTGDIGLPEELVLRDRNAFDFRWIGGKYSTRYRNRLRLDRKVPLANGRSVTPYADAEITYTFSTASITRVRVQAGADYQWSRSLGVDLSLNHQNDRSASTNNVNALQLTLNVFW